MSLTPALDTFLLAQLSNHTCRQTDLISLFGLYVWFWYLNSMDLVISLYWGLNQHETSTIWKSLIRVHNKVMTIIIVVIYKLRVTGPI